MAKQGKSTEKTKVHRIKATDDAPKKTKKSQPKAVKKTTSKPVAKTTSNKNLLSAIGGYFRGAWEELKQVRWPNRRTTWAMTSAVIIFTIIFVIFILLVDAGFNWVFEKILK